MIRVLAALFAAVAFVVPLLTMPARAVAVIGSLGLLLATVAIVAFRTWVATIAACVFIMEYAAALWMAPGSVHVIEAIGVGLAVLFLLDAVDLACRVRGATVDRLVVRFELARWVGLGLGALLVIGVAMPLATSLAMAVPPVMAPVMTAAAALAALLLLTAVIRRVARRG